MNKIIALLFALVALRAQAQVPVLDWKAPATLPTYLLRQVHQQYAPRRAALDAALALAAGTAPYRDSARACFRRVLGPLPEARRYGRGWWARCRR